MCRKEVRTPSQALTLRYDKVLLILAPPMPRMEGPIMVMDASAMSSHCWPRCHLTAALTRHRRQIMRPHPDSHELDELVSRLAYERGLRVCEIENVIETALRRRFEEQPLAK